MNLKEAMQVIEDRVSQGKMFPELLFEFSEDDEGNIEVNYFSGRDFQFSEVGLKSFEEAIIELAKDLSGVK